MIVLNKQADLAAHLQFISKAETSIGFVPTMGALHAGHLSLLKESEKNNTFSVASIFVNPTQFNNSEDLKKYPRTLEADVKKIHTVSENIIIYAPSVDDVYGGNPILQHFDFDGLENPMEGQARPGHFDGVGTIVKRLFEIVKPTNAYFGEKDFQQLLIIKKMVEKENMPVNIISCPVYRELNGLAMSSRNQRLTVTERQEASLIYKTLQAAKDKFTFESAEAISNWVKETFKQHPFLKLEYFHIADEETLTPYTGKKGNKKYRAFIAVFVNNIRLIDTISLN